MSNPEAQLKHKLRQLHKDDEADSVDEEGDRPPQSKSSLFSDIRETVTKHTAKMRSQVSRGRGKVVRVIKKKFPVKKEKHETNATEIGGFQAASPPLYPQLRECWLGVSAEDVAKDVHRLIYRVTVKTSGQRDILLQPPAKEDRGGSAKAAEAVAGLVRLLAKRMCEPEEAQTAYDLCDDLLVGVDDATDMVDFNLRLMKGLGEDSCIVKVLRCLHQTIVLKPYGILRTVMIKDKLTKDVRGDDGWKVEITVAHEGFIQVVHVRKEQSVDFATKNQPDRNKNHWEYQWEVSMTFDKNMEEMNQSRLSITNLVLSEGMDPDLEKDLRHIMQNGQLIVF